MAHTISTVATLTVGDWIIADGGYQQITEIMDMPASDMKGASRFIHHTSGMLAMYACEPIAVEA